MTIEILYLTTQMQRWINLRVARHLEAQAAKLKPTQGRVLLGAYGPGGSVGLDRHGLPDGAGLVDESDNIGIADGADFSTSQAPRPDSEKQTVHA
jgi:hypothetical protein